MDRAQARAGQRQRGVGKDLRAALARYGRLSTQSLGENVRKRLPARERIPESQGNFQRRGDGRLAILNRSLGVAPLQLHAAIDATVSLYLLQDSQTSPGLSGPGSFFCTRGDGGTTAIGGRCLDADDGVKVGRSSLDRMLASSQSFVEQFRPVTNGQRSSGLYVRETSDVGGGDDLR